MSVTCANYKQTGRSRHRVQQRLWRSPLLVLQLEWEYDSTEWSPYGDSGPTRQHTVWRDAAVEDGIQFTYRFREQA